ncbi:CPBP family intramembrane glutamic endopeptidase [Pasteuria penetrans]|uniref:CPBP family intramembrane glutamic endopeptidase n=1 Tax=Pasteuria penetrans TaxID=86005 RepID=UPI000F98BAB3|nr:CPBP family intramembrane glutamic endopeptidase [Pasteuria penetrans]
MQENFLPTLIIIFMSLGLILLLVSYFTTWAFVKFDHAYYQHTVVMEHSPRQRSLQNWGKTVNMLFALFYFIFTALQFLYPPSPHPFDGGIVEIACNSSALLIYLFIGIFFLLPSVRDRVMITLGLNTQRYLHRILIAWLAHHIAVLVTMFPKIPLQGYDFCGSIVGGMMGADNVQIVQKYLSIGIPCINSLLSTLWASLGAGWPTTRTLKETTVRLGLHKKPTGKAWSIVTLLTLSSLGIWFLGDTLLYWMQEALNIPPSEAVFPLRVDWIGAFLLILFSALGEELLYRGAIQPRLGIVWTSVISTMGSTILQMQMIGNGGGSWQSLFWIFLASLGLGWLADRYHLWASIWAHILLKTYIVLYIMEWA